MKEQIKTILNQIIKSEGGYVDHPNDKGGPTKYGITLKALSTYRAQYSKPLDIMQLQTNEAEEIYYDSYYINPSIDQLPDIYQHFMLDSAINHGQKTAIRMLQLELLEQGIPTLADGIIGKNTIACSNEAAEKIGTRFITGLIDRRKKFYQSIVSRHPDQQVFLAGWLNRADSFKQEQIA